MVFCLDFQVTLRKIIRRFLDSCNEIPKVATKHFSLIMHKKTRHEMCLVIYYLERAKSFNERRNILPVVFFGNSVKNSKLRGTLYFAKCSAQ